MALPALAALIASAIPQLLPAATEPGIIWKRSHFEAEYATLNAAAVSDTGRIVTVGEGGVTRYSDDNGLTWNTPEPDIHYGLQDVIWDGSRFIAVGGFLFETGIVLTSVDGANWNRICLGSSQQLFCVASSGSIIVAMGRNNNSFTSEDTSSWAGAPAGTAEYFDAVWTGTQFVRVGYDGLIETSPGGTTWTPRSSGTTENIEAVAWNDSLLVAVGRNSAANVPLVLTSPDGLTWMNVNMSAFPGNSLHAVTWTGTRFVACGGANQILTSTDGAAWTSHSAGTNVLIEDLLWTGTDLFAVGERGIILKTDQAEPDDPADWTLSADNEAVPSFNAFAQHDVGGTDRIVAVGTNGMIAYSDDDGITGADATTVTSSTLNGLTATSLGSRRFIAVGHGGTIVVSSNGSTWDVDTPAPTDTLYGVAWAKFVNPMENARAIAVGDNGAILTGEYDPVWAWTTRPSGTSESLRSVTHGVVLSGKPPVASSLVVAVGLNGTILTSTTGTTWTSRSSGTTEHLYCVIPTVGGGFLAVGGHGVVLRSANGVDWTNYSTGGSRYLYSVTSTGSQYVAVGNSGEIFTSVNGDSWTRRYGDTNNSLHALLTSTSGRILTGGTGGIIMYSDPAIDFDDWISAQSPPAGMDDPDDDPNGDGITNLVAYGHGIPAVAPSSPADLARLPRLVDPVPGQPARIRIGVNDSDLGDAVYIIDWSPDLSPGSWTEILRHTPGQECATGSAHVYSEDTGFAEIEIPEAIGALPGKFYRLRTELSP